MKIQDGWLLGVLTGDGCIGERFIQFTNNNMELIKLFLNKIMELNISVSGIVANINTTTNLKNDAENLKVTLLKLGVKKVFITLVKQNLNKPVIQLFLFDRKTANDFRRNISTFLKIPLTQEIPSFIQGFFDAEGSIHKRDKAIEAKQKSNKKGKRIMKFLELNLKRLGIKCSLEGPNCEKMLILRVWGGKRNKENMIKFQKVVGFSHPEKSALLKSIISELSMAKSLAV